MEPSIYWTTKCSGYTNMRKVLFIFLFLLSFGTAQAQQLPDVGEQIKNSKGDIKYLREGCTLAYTIKNRHLFCATPTSTGGGGDITTDNNATKESKKLEELLTTVTGQTFVETSGTIPANANVTSCNIFTVTDISGGYLYGVEGAPDVYAEMSGVAGENSDGDLHKTGDQRQFVEDGVRITAPGGGTFVDPPGSARATCFYTENHAADQ